MPIDESKDQISLFDLTTPAPTSTIREATPEVPVPRKPTRGALGKATGKKTATRNITAAVRGSVPQRGAKSAPGPVPEGDVRLTANIRQDLHLKLKIAAATRRTTIGELIEGLVEQYL